VGASCLDAGPTPKGRHVIVDRDENQVQFVDGPTGQPRRLLLSRSHTEPGSSGLTTQRLSTVDDPGPGGGLGALRLVIDHYGQSQFCGIDGCGGIPVDALGRLYLVLSSFAPSSSSLGFTDQFNVLVQVDPATGAQRPFGQPQSVEVSADRARVAIEVQPEGTTPPHVVLDVDGQEVTVPGQSLHFVSDDLFFVSDDDNLSRLARAAQTIEPLVANVGGFEAFETQRGPLLAIGHLGIPTPSGRESLFDVSKLEEEALGPTTAMAARLLPSPSGRYVAAYSSTATASGQTTVIARFDRDTGQEAIADDPKLSATNQPAVLTWRPAQDELWFIAGGEVFRWRPEGVPEMVAPDTSLMFAPFRPLSASPQPEFGGVPIFTPDGQFRFVTTPDGSDKPPILLQSADDAAAPPLLLNPKGTGVAGLWPLSDGRLLVEDWFSDQLRDDIYLVDPGARTARPLASSGYVVAAGRDRFLAVLRYVAAGGSGDLTSIDYATGTETLIAENVHSVTVDASSDPTDALAPGTRVAYLVRNRIASPYDGLWVTDLP